jgi:hypothetical protein
VNKYSVIGIVLIVLAIIIFTFCLIVPILNFFNVDTDLQPVVKDDGPYFEKIFVLPFPYWDQDYVEIEMIGNYDKEDLDSVTEIMDEWNGLVDRPKLIMGSDLPTDIILEFKDVPGEGWAGATWNTGEYPVTESYIIIRTDYTYCRENVIRHELGHAMGLAYHSGHLSSSIYKCANIFSSYWSNEDIVVIHTIYG